MLSFQGLLKNVSDGHKEEGVTNVLKFNTYYLNGPLALMQTLGEVPTEYINLKCLNKKSSKLLDLFCRRAQSRMS